jgi:Uma2 family endonuclease
MVIRHRMTVAEYLALPEEKPYLEYINGEVCPKVAPDRGHSDIADAILGALWEYRKEHGGRSAVEGRVRFDDPSDTRYLLPDVAYYAPGRPRGDRIMTPPTLAVEIRSPEQSIEAQRDKCRFYRAHGVEAAWLVDPQERTVEVFEGSIDGRVLASGEILRSEHLPGFRLPLSDLFAALDT